MVQGSWYTLVAPIQQRRFILVRVVATPILKPNGSAVRKIRPFLAVCHNDLHQTYRTYHIDSVRHKDQVYSYAVVLEPKLRVMGQNYSMLLVGP